MMIPVSPKRIVCAVCEDAVYQRDAYYCKGDWVCSVECEETLKKRRKASDENQDS